MRAFAEAGAGIFPSASMVGEQLCRQAGMIHLGDADGVTETYYAISVERRLTHPAVRAISEAATAKQKFV
jgi:LysR family transcriptional activator of nhaA